MFGFNIFILGKGNSTLEPKAQTAGAYHGFLNMRHAQEYCYSSLDGMLVCRRVTPQQYVVGYSFIHLGEEVPSGVKILV